MVYYLILFGLLFGVWIILSGILSPLLLILGFLSCVIAVFITVRMYGKPNISRQHVSLIWQFPFYLGWLFKEIIHSSFTVAFNMWKKTPDVSPQFAWLPLKILHEVGVVMYANSITLTPGTVTVRVEEDKILVHALQKSGIADLKKGQMQMAVKNATQVFEVKGKKI